jgi:translation initiation factor 2B subunit (eIF-2B alpha/beta/delta family)
MVDYILRQVIPIKINPLKFPGVTSQGFPILDHLDEQIRKLNNELQKENKVMCGVEVLIQTVNSDTSRCGELESNKGITERKIEELKRQLKKTEGKMNGIMFELLPLSS